MMRGLLMQANLAFADAARESLARLDHDLGKDHIGKRSSLARHGRRKESGVSECIRRHKALQHTTRDVFWTV